MKVQSCKSRQLRIIIILSAGFLLTSLVISQTKFGLKPVAGFWYGPGTPILSWQAFIAWLMIWLPYLVSGIPIMQSIINKLSKQKPWRLDLMIAVFIWLGTIIIWWNTPLQNNSFAIQSMPPNYINYPYSDAANYDINAIKTISGQYMSTSGVNKPAYTFLLIFFRLISGGDYSLMIFLQIIVMAAIPVFSFLIVKSFFSRTVGLAVAFLVMIREVNAISIPDILTVSHVKLLMSDVPTMALVIAMVYVLLLWIQKSIRFSITPFIAGVIMGFLYLLRIQTIAIVPVILLLFFLYRFKRDKKDWYFSSIIFILGAFLVIIPWNIRNALVPNSIDDYVKNDYQRLLIQNYGKLYEHLIEINPEESLPLYYDRAQKELTKVVLSNPGLAVSGISSYVMHNIIDSIMYLPLHYRGNDIVHYLENLNYVNNWKMKLPPISIVFLGINLILIAAGSVNVFQKSSKIFWLLFLVYLSYIFTNSIFLHSGLRIILPVDWVPLIFYSAGVWYWVSIMFSHQAGNRDGINSYRKNENEIINTSVRFPTKRVILASIIVIILGSILPFYEFLMKDKLQPKPLDYYLITLKNGECGELHPDFFKESEISKFLVDDQAVVTSGASLYPRFYEAGEGNYGTYWKEFEVQDYPRLSMMLLGKELNGVIIRNAEPPSTFPHNEEVIVVGCMQERLIDVLMIQTKDGKCYQRDSLTNLTCTP